MTRTKDHSARVDELVEQLKKYDSHALAIELACLVVGLGCFVNLDEMMEGLKRNSALARKSRALKTEENKRKRLKVLCEKVSSGKKLSKEENKEALKLCKDLGIKL
jgi:hypothetical protein